MRNTKVVRLAAGNTNRLSLFCDVSGRSCKENQRYEFFTGAGVVIPASDEAKIRASIGRNTPKWNGATPLSLSQIGHVLLGNPHIHCAVVRIHKTEPAWTKFWDDGDQQYNQLRSQTGIKLGFAKPGNVLKGWVMGKCLAIGLGSHLYSQGKPIVLGPDRLSALYLRITCDTDMENRESQEAFEWSWAQLCEHTKLSTLFGIKPNVDTIEFTTEQDENLLLLPDYLAGHVQYSLDQTGCVPLPVGLSPEDAAHFGQTLSALKESRRFTFVEHSFDELFPKLGSP